MKRFKLFMTVALCAIITAAVPIWDPVSLPAFDHDQIVERGLSWLAASQQQDGSWGAGSHSRQDVLDPGTVSGDAATTAFAGLALVRAGSNLQKGPYRQQVRRAVLYLIQVVDSSPFNSPQITEIRGTQPQVKLGNNIDVALTAQFLTRILSDSREDQLESAIRKSLQTCIRKLEMTQQGDGSWTQGGWAGVLQSAAAYNALESARGQGLDTDDRVFKKAKDYQQGNVRLGPDAAPSVKTDAAAGIPLYSVAGNQRATARDAKKVQEIVEEGLRQGKVKPGVEISKQTLKALDVPEEEAEYLAEAYQKNQVTQRQLNDEQVLSGFGNNGGEEFLSYMLTSESLIITGGQAWKNWDNNMVQRLSKIQNNNGSWSGHHCITSPVFCTAAALLTLTTSLDEGLLTGVEEW